MIRFFLILFLVILLVVNGSWIDKTKNRIEDNATFETMKLEMNQMKRSPNYKLAVEKVRNGFNWIATELNLKQQVDTTQINPPKLAVPSKQMFSIYNIEIGDTKKEVEKHIGIAKRSSLNEYGVNWYTYHNNYQNFMMVAYDKNNLVIGLFTNQSLISSTNGLKLGSPKASVHQTIGQPLTQIRKGLTIYQLETDSNYDVYLNNNSYITIFYDKYQENTVTAMQVISKDVEQNKKDFYTAPSKEMEKGFEYQLFDLTNATRVKHHLNILTWDEHVKGTALHHSEDMALHNYFDHNNLKGESPFDRMHNDGIVYTIAGENLAAGQFSSVFAHEGLMNSLGHRENILRPEFAFLGVGVAFNSESRPYYTEDFYH